MHPIKRVAKAREGTAKPSGRGQKISPMFKTDTPQQDFGLIKESLARFLKNKTAHGGPFLFFILF
jgi:hypothetical protein